MIGLVGDKLFPYNGSRNNIQDLAEKDRCSLDKEINISYSTCEVSAKKLLNKWFNESYKKKYKEKSLHVEVLNTDDTKELEESVSGSISFSLNDGNKCSDLKIYIKNERVEHRKKFTLMHEVGHFRLHIVPRLLEEGRGLRENENSFIESQANLYSASFLAPRHMIKKSLISKASASDDYKSQLRKTNFNSGTTDTKQLLIKDVAESFGLFYNVIYYVIKNNYAYFID